VRIFTIGFTRKKAREFFESLKKGGVKKIVDVRLNNVSQLAGFAKRDDLKYFLGEFGIGYEHRPELAPTKDILDAYKRKPKKSKEGVVPAAKMEWPEYERRFLDLMKEREIEKKIRPEELDGGCLLCSEDKPHHCHRRLVAEYLGRFWKGMEVKNL
jgi:uncharacterized protein (DUF488 family)